MNCSSPIESGLSIECGVYQSPERRLKLEPGGRPTDKSMSLILRHCNIAYTSSVASGLGQHGMPPLASNPDLGPFDLACASHLRWETFLPNLGTLARPLAFGFSNYSLCTRRTDRQTDGRTKATLIAHFPTVRGIIIWLFSKLVTNHETYSVIHTYRGS